MARNNPTKRQKYDSYEGNQDTVFVKREDKEPLPQLESQVHVIGPGVVCETERRGHATPVPQAASPLDLGLHVSEGFVALWARNTTLRWRFHESSMYYFADPAAAKNGIRDLFAQAVQAWGFAAPVTFKYDNDVWDFEISMRSADQCTPNGCTLASAFFPDSGRHRLELYPRLFTQTPKERVDTFIHEIGHIFGLRHWFAHLTETAWPSVIFGTHNKFSIMNYGEWSELTETDRADLARLYQMAWSGALTNINGTPIGFVRPYHVLATFAAMQEVPVSNTVSDIFAPAGRDNLGTPGHVLAMHQLQPRAACLRGTQQ